MAEVTVEATAVAFRRGSHEDIEVFKGIEGEMVVDLTDHAVVVCDGAQRGGYPMARADFSNTDTEWLAEPNQTPKHSGKNLCYFDFTNADITNLMNSNSKPIAKDEFEGKKLLAWDLSNLHNHSQSTQADRDNITQISGILKSDYHLAAADLSNYERIPLDMPITTRRNIADGLEADYYLADSDARNIYTKNLAEGLPDTSANGNRDTSIYGKNLAYADMSNVNTEYLATSDSTHTHSGTNLAYADFSNVDLSTALQDYELLENKATIIQTSTLGSTYYPTTQAVADYVSQVTSVSCASRTLDNIIDWTYATVPSDYSEYEPQLALISGGSNYEVGDVLSFRIIPTGGTSEDAITLRYDVTEVESGAVTEIEINSDSEPLTFEISSSVTVSDNNSEHQGTSASFSLITGSTPSKTINGGGLLKTDLTNIEEALNILKVAPTVEVTDSIRVNLNHKQSQVYPITVREGVTNLSLTLAFSDEFSATARNAYVYELHISVGEQLPEITWLIADAGHANPPAEIRWLQQVTSPIEANKTALYVIRQQQDNIIANYAGCY